MRRKPASNSGFGRTSIPHSANTVRFVMRGGIRK